MSGGTWTTQNKVRPDAYINFKSVTSPSASVGTRGVVTAPLPLSWGPEGGLIELTSTKFFGSAALPLVGFTAYDDGEQAIRLREALKYAPKGLFYRIPGTGSAKASVDLISAADVKLTVTAKYPGVFGNRLSVGVSVNRTVDSKTYYDVAVYVDGKERASLSNVSALTDLTDSGDNGYVAFSVTGSPVLAAVSPVYLTGGSDGTVTETVANLADYFTLMGRKKWNCMALPFNLGSDLSTVKAKAQAWRDSGLKVQIACWSADDSYDSNKAADCEGIIQTDGQGYATEDDEIVVTPEDFIMTVAGMTAGAAAYESNTCRIIDDAVRIIRYGSKGAVVDGELEIDDLEEKLDPGSNGTSAGYFLLQMNDSDEVMVSKDINSFSSFTDEKNYDFSKNRIVREMDQTDSDVTSAWRKTFAGKITNNTNGRKMFNGTVNDLFKEYKRLQMVEDIDDDGTLVSMDISAGTKKEAVVVTLAVKYCDAMEILYLTVNCN
jgi:hypothetical protein